jgi:hypothetical protein
MVIFHTGKVEAPAATAWKPESTPVPLAVTKRVQGFANDDWVTEWFLPRNSKLIESPELTVTKDGENVSPSIPTKTGKSAAEAKATEARTKAAVVKCIFGIVNR